MTSIFTLITPSFNNYKYLDSWSKSILLQDYRPLRVVFVDDFSNDETEFNFQKYGNILSKQDIQCTYVRNNKRMFYGSCLKIGYEHAKGDFFGCLDADDALMDGAVSSVMKHYEKNKDIQYIYTQFMNCDYQLNSCKKGFSSIPPSGSNLLDEGKKNKHCYSHFRTFSNRIERIDKIWGEGMRCAVDKFMGYRLEELAKGMFLDKPCYMWRTGRKDSISKTEPSRATWNQVMIEARKRRVRWNLKPIPIEYASE